jgi:hypothetical protein
MHEKSHKKERGTSLCGASSALEIFQNMANAIAHRRFGFSKCFHLSESNDFVVATNRVDFNRCTNEEKIGRRAEYGKGERRGMEDGNGCKSGTRCSRLEPRPQFLSVQTSQADL